MLLHAITHHYAIRSRVFLTISKLNKNRHLHCQKSKMSSQLFQGKDIASAYVSYRPVYPPALKSEILAYCQENGGNTKYNLLVDIGCGSGQSTLIWSDTFSKVIGFDVSQAQIDKAPKDVLNAEFRVGNAEQINLDDDSTELLTIGQAMHWVETEKFYAEVKRILVHGGVLAVYGYGNLTLDKPEASHIVFKEIYENTLKKGNYWDQGRNHIDDKYAQFTPLPFKDFKRIDSLAMTKTWPLDHFIGYISSWSGYRSYMAKHPESTILDDMKQRLGEIYKDGEELVITWPIFLLLGRK